MKKDKNIILLKMLTDAKEVFKLNDLEFWLDCGTLLGIVRDNGFIPWENDIDLGCWKSINDFGEKKKIKKDFLKLGYNVYLTDYWINIHFDKYPDINLDINYYTKENGLAVTPGLALFPALIDKRAIMINHLIRFLYNKKLYVKRLNLINRLLIRSCFSIIYATFIVLPLNFKSTILNFLIKRRKSISQHKAFIVDLQYFNNLKKISIFNGQYLIPEKSEEYLQYRYGDSWRTPIREWDTLTQDKTVKNI